MKDKSIGIVGGGDGGSTIALKLAERGYSDIIVIEKEEFVGEHTSGRNSGVLHSGINQKPGSLKALMCVEGNWSARQFCKIEK